MIRCARAVLLGAGLALWAGAALAQGADETAPDPSPIPKAPPGVAHAYDAPYRSDTFELKMERAGREGSEIEYFVRMKAGQTLVYSWSVAAPPEEFYYDFHSEERPSAKEHVISHKSGLGVAGNGALTAPFDGIHGWYLQNQSVKPVTVKLRLAGFYDLLPGGRPPG